MKRTIAAAAFAISALALPALAGTVSGDVYTDPSVPIAVAKGSEILIALPSNPTTGYAWTARIAGGAVESEGNAYQARPVAPGIVGSGGQQIFAIEAEAAGSAVITFSYARSFEKGKPPAKTMVFHVTVK